MSMFTLPELSQAQQASLQEAFATDLEYLKSIEKNNLPTHSLFIQSCSSPAHSILTEEEARRLHELTDPSEQHAEILRMVKDRGSKAMQTFYLFLNMNKPELYEQLPSSKSNDKKIELISKLKGEFFQNLRKNFSDISQSGFPGLSKPTASVATVRPLIHTNEETQHASKEEKERNRGKDKLKKETETLNDDDEEKPRPKYQRRTWGIQKDDEFFHFIVICFSIGTALIASYNYADWAISAGIGLICFATIETIAIYFGLIQKIRRILDYLQNYKLPAFVGWTKQK
uniref:CARD domain-containing protein n=1 Tax=Leptobrachium leishanense TaxID=445787 RepID=A0A8C5RA03_9ANUR